MQVLIFSPTGNTYRPPVPFSVAGQLFFGDLRHPVKILADMHKWQPYALRAASALLPVHRPVPLCAKRGVFGDTLPVVWTCMRTADLDGNLHLRGGFRNFIANGIYYLKLWSLSQQTKIVPL